MSVQLSPDERPLVEICSVPAVYVTCIAKIERVGGDCVQILMARDTTDSAGLPVRLVEGPPLIVPIALLRDEIYEQVKAWLAMQSREFMAEGASHMLS